MKRKSICQLSSIRVWIDWFETVSLILRHHERTQLITKPWVNLGCFNFCCKFLSARKFTQYTGGAEWNFTCTAIMKCDLFLPGCNVLDQILQHFILKVYLFKLTFIHVYIFQESPRPCVVHLKYPYWVLLSKFRLRSYFCMSRFIVGGHAKLLRLE